MIMSLCLPLRLLPLCEWDREQYMCTFHNKLFKWWTFFSLWNALWRNMSSLFQFNSHIVRRWRRRLLLGYCEEEKIKKSVYYTQFAASAACLLISQYESLNRRCEKKIISIFYLTSFILPYYMLYKRYSQSLTCCSWLENQKKRFICTQHI